MISPPLAVRALFTILGLNTIVLIIIIKIPPPRNPYPTIPTATANQHQQQRQQQHKKLKNTTKIIVPIIDNNDILFSAVCVTCYSCSSVSF
jgi:hypothetical protein